VLGVGHGHAPADPSAAEVFPLHDRLHDPLEIAGGDLPRIDERLRHLADHALLGGGVDVGADRVVGDEIGKLHA
jgi:hypothetical protein